MNNDLIITSLEKAITSFEVALKRQAETPNDDLIRDGCIQRFEYTYELSHKMLKRFLEMTSANPAEIDGMTFQTLIRTGNERGLLKSDWPKWRTYRTARGSTSHTYNEDKAKEVFALAHDFLDEAIHLRNALQKELGQ